MAVVLAALLLASAASHVTDSASTKDDCKYDPDMCDVKDMGTTALMKYMNTQPPQFTTPELSPEMLLHSYADERVNQSTLYDLLKLADTIVSKRTRHLRGNTTVLLDVEKIVENADVPAKSYKVENLTHISVAVEEASANVATVMAFKRIAGHGGRNKSWEIQTNSNSSSDDLDYASDDVVVRLPPANISTAATAIVYADPEKLFRERDTQKGKVLNSDVVNVKISGEARLPYVDTVFRMKMNVHGCEEPVCEYWNHSETDEGRWSGDGCRLMRVGKGKVFCRCSHLTHFGSLIQNSPMELGRAHDAALDAITYLGCAMSLAGVGRIVAVAAARPRWRRDVGHKLVLCLAVNVALMTTLFLPVAVGAVGSGPACVAVGAGLHYLLLSSFAWTLVSAWLQYRRFVVGICAPVTHLILRMSLLSWALPLLPVAVLLCVDPHIYANRNLSCHPRTVCFPTDVYFYATVTAPVGLVVLANAFIFARVVHAFFGCARKVRPTRGGSKSTRVLFMVVFEFFLLGLPWVFGLLSAVHVVFLYLFCLTATQHGFVLFLFFVFLKKPERHKLADTSAGVACNSEARNEQHRPPEMMRFKRVSDNR
ncbi:adhesion G-protein coupled receptor G2-like [Bacillus rossius redtenbacheri]|uniref:adhesion G-protein coupled receptor G2-like n=1 Tax=Bacillus rossius redtenbacheri TaxID=93214 RepID=UPI002FDE264A